MTQGSAAIDIADATSQSIIEDNGFRKSKNVKIKREMFARQKSYNWRTYSPDDRSCWHFFRWLMLGDSTYAMQTDDEVYENLCDLAKCLNLLREYLARFGMPEKGTREDQEFVLQEVVRDLYGGGAPLWALEAIMKKAAEGLTGNPRVSWLLLPRQAFVSAPLHGKGTTHMFKIDRGFSIAKLEDMETVSVRLASFASNTDGVGSIPSRIPSSDEYTAALAEPRRSLFPNMENMAKEILDLSSRAQGLSYYLNSQQYQHNKDDNTVDEFWTVSQEEKELFTRLVCIEAMQKIEEDDAKHEALNRYPTWLAICFRVVASSGSAAFWFNGSWQDMVVSGLLSIVVAFVFTSPVLSKQEKIVYEIIASFLVGLASGCVSLQWPEQTCFGAMATAGVLDLLQGFRVVYAVIEVMSKHTVAGGADLVEGILFTGLIAYFIRFGEYVASYAMGVEWPEFAPCKDGISDYWNFLLVPLAALSWSGLFTPSYRDLIPMGLHGTMAFAINYGLAASGFHRNANSYISALVVSLSAGITSRFTGRQAVGNTVAGLYAIVPGAYLVKSLYSPSMGDNFFMEVIQTSIVIGIGAGSGSLLCSPTLLGITKGFVMQLTQQTPTSRNRQRQSEQATMLIF